LVALYRVYPDTNLYSIALNAGERLLQGRQRNAQGDRIWYGSVLNNGGFGSSGVLIALVRLFELSQDYRFLRAAFEITQLEDAHYDESRGGWPDLRHTPASYPITWCHGSVGVAMGRVALLPHQPVTHDHRMLSELLEGIDSVGLHEEDGLCCGNTGAIDTLLSVARALNAPHYLRRALYWSTQMVARAHDRGGYVCSSSQPGIYEHPGLWQGNAGIAYQLARCAYPRLFPSLLSGDMRRPVATTTEQ
jgi:lantibiotic modifying enzyme